MNMKGEYLGTGGNAIHTALEGVRSLSPHVLTYPTAAILLCSPLLCSVAISSV